MHEEPCTDPYARFCERTASLLSQGASYSMLGRESIVTA